MARMPRGCWAARRRRAHDRLRRGSARSAAVVNRPRGFTWTGVRERARGRWAAQVRVPGSRTRLWIGMFDQPLQAALAYDTALFCFYGAHRLPSARRFNIPAAPRPSIPETVRAALTLADIRGIAQSHACTIANFFIGPLPAVIAAAAPRPPAAAADGAAAVADEATATTDGSNSNN